jgi:O-methyltransferase
MLERIYKAARRAVRWRLRWVQRDYHARLHGMEFSYQSIIRNQAYAPWMTDTDFHAVYDRVRGHTMVGVERCYELWDLMHNPGAASGAVVEVGVWRGGTAAILAAALARTRPAETIYLCDTFRGVAKAGHNDSLYRGGEHADTSVASVTELLRSLSLDNAVLLAGVFPEQTASQIPPGPISLCHIDVDVYESAKDTVEWVEERLQPGGMLVFDDYGFPSCIGVTFFVNEIKATGRWTAIYNLNGHAVLIKR